MTSNTGIRIETVREITNNGDIGYKITGITALKRDQLPAMYLNDQGPSVYFDEADDRTPNKCLYLKNDGKEDMYIDSWSYISARFYSVSDMEKINAHVRAASQHLTDVNTHLRKEREAWHGKVTFIDGVVATKDEAVPSENPEEISIPLAERIAELWREGRLLYRNKKGHIKPLKPLA